MITPQTFFKFYRNITILHEGKHVSVDHVHHDGGVVLKKDNAMDIARLHQLKVHMLSMESMTHVNIRTLLSLVMNERLSDVGEYRTVSKDKLSITVDYGGVFMSINRGNISVTDNVNGAREVGNVGAAIMYLIENQYPVFDTDKVSFRDLIEFSVLY